MPPKIPAPPSLSFVRTNSNTNNLPQSTPLSATKKPSEETWDERFKSNRRALIALITEGCRNESAIKDEQTREFKTIMDAFEKIRGPRPRALIKTSDNSAYWSKDTRHTYYLTAILNSNEDHFSGLLRQAHEIGTATQYSPAYRQNELLITAIQRAIAHKDSTRNQFVTRLLLISTVQSELNQDKVTYYRILNLLFMATDRPHVVKLREAICTSTTNSKFKAYFHQVQLKANQRHVLFVEQQHQLESELTQVQTHVSSEEKNQFTAILDQEQTSVLAIKKIEAVNKLLFMADKQYALLSAAEKNQLDTLLTQAKAQLVSTKKIETLNQFNLIEAQQRVELYSIERHQRDDILSKTSIKPISNTKLTADRITINALATLCQNYLMYVCKALKCDPSTINIKKYKDSNKQRGLIKKFEFVERLYGITQMKSSDPKNILKTFKTQFSNPVNQALLQSHRDEVFVRFMLSLWNILKLIPSLLNRTSTKTTTHPGFWKPAKGKVLADALRVKLGIM